ncbi:MAG: response regulator transcription factor [Hyphomicrobiales bacterium]
MQPTRATGTRKRQDPLVVVVDDDRSTLRLLSLELPGQGFRVLAIVEPERALQIIDQVRPDVVVLDLVMPRVTGIDLLRAIRTRRGIAVILLTGKTAIADRVRGLDLGADDYVTKPFNVDELAARIRAVLRRSGGDLPDPVLRVRDLEIDLGRRMVRREGEPLHLSRTEWQLLQQLALNAGKVVSQRELLAKVWGPDYLMEVQYLRVWISRLRHRIERDPHNPEVVRTLTGLGYLIEPDPRGIDPETQGSAVA